MEWFQGEIANAISESKSKQLIFLVYAFDADSNQMNDLWNSNKVYELCKENCVCLKLEANTQICNQFREIYRFDQFPTTYFIGNNGFPIDVINGSIDENELISKLQRAIEVHQKQKELNAQDKPSASASQPSTSQQSDEAVNKKSVEEKVAQAKEKLRQLQEKKKAEEEEKERNNEIERRKLGQEVIKSKREKEENELKRLAEEKKREKLEDELARQRIREKIQQDREEKQKKYAKERDELEKTKEAASARLAAETLAKQQAEAARLSQIARIKFTFVDGSSVTNQFEPSQSFNDVHEFVRTKLVELNMASSNFSIHSTFPKREYTQQDMKATLRELGLAPSATLLVIPNANRSSAVKKITNAMPSTSTVSTTGVFGVVSDILSLVFLPVTIIWGVITGLFGASNNNSSTTRPSSSSSPMATSSSSSSDLRRRHMADREFGSGSNIGTLHGNRRDDKDDRATWNGNSTQQM